jgi:hypothetical protein
MPYPPPQTSDSEVLQIRIFLHEKSVFFSSSSNVSKMSRLKWQGQIISDHFILFYKIWRQKFLHPYEC